MHKVATATSFSLFFFCGLPLISAKDTIEEKGWKRKIIYKQKPFLLPFISSANWKPFGALTFLVLFFGASVHFQEWEGIYL